jgi:hypothetical protein
MYQLTFNKFVPEHTEYGIFKLQAAALCEDFAQDVADRARMLVEDLELSDDAINHTEIQNSLLQHVTAFALNQPALPVTVDSRLFDYDHALEYFTRADSPTDESPVSECYERWELESRIKQLEKENARLREEQSIAALRYRPSRRVKQMFSTLDEYVENMMRSAVREELASMGLTI